MEVMKVDIGGPGRRWGYPGAEVGQAGGRQGFRGLKAMRELMSDGVAGAAGQLLGGGGSGAGWRIRVEHQMVLMRLTGPGRVGMQSMYQHKATD